MRVTVGKKLDLADLVELWSACRAQRNDRTPDEFTVSEYQEAANVSVQAARYQLRELCKLGRITSRRGMVDGRCVNLYRRSKQGEK